MVGGIASPTRRDSQWVREIQIGTPCKVRLNIYLVGYGEGRGKGRREKEQRQGERENQRRGEEEPRQQLPLWERDERWKRKGLRL